MSVLVFLRFVMSPGAPITTCSEHVLRAGTFRRPKHQQLARWSSKVRGECGTIAAACRDLSPRACAVRFSFAHCAAYDIALPIENPTSLVGIGPSCGTDHI